MAKNEFTTREAGILVLAPYDDPLTLDDAADLAAAKMLVRRGLLATVPAVKNQFRITVAGEAIVEQMAWTHRRDK